MPPYKVSSKALQDMAEIISYLHREVGESVATRVEKQLFRSFHDLGLNPILGHLRQDLTGKNILFYTSHPYIILHRRTRNMTQILRVLHGARDLRKFL